MVSSYNGINAPPLEYNNEAWDVEQTASSSDVYASSNNGDSIAGWAASQSTLTFDYESWQTELSIMVPGMYQQQSPQQTMPLWSSSLQLTEYDLPNTVTSAVTAASEQPVEEPKYQELNAGGQSTPSWIPSATNPPADSTTKSTCSGTRVTASAIKRRRTQNRDSQRAFRDRQKIRMGRLEGEVLSLIEKNKTLEADNVRLQADHRALKEERRLKDDCMY